MEKTRAVIFLNGTFTSTGASTFIPGANDLIIAVDGGIRHPRLSGITPDILIGDLDSIDPVDLEWCQSQQVEIRKYPKEKNETDFELALDHAVGSVAGVVIVYGALGGRIDHALANIGLLSDPRYTDREIKISIGTGDDVLYSSEGSHHRERGADPLFDTLGRTSNGSNNDRYGIST